MARMHDDTLFNLPMLAVAPWLLGMTAFSERMALFAWHPRHPSRPAPTHDLPLPDALESAEMPELFA